VRPVASCFVSRFCILASDGVGLDRITAALTLSNIIVFSVMSIIVVGSGVFGLQTAIELSLRRPKADILILDRSPYPVPDASSIDTTRIVRADYADATYARLADQAQEVWRSDPELKQHYHESGLLLFAKEGHEYVHTSYANVCGTDAVRWLPSNEVNKLTGREGMEGYLNTRSGWCNAEAAMKVIYTRARKRPNIRMESAQVESMLISASVVHGVVTKDGRRVYADTVVLAAGAWSPSLVSLSSHITATGQVLAYFSISPEQQKKMRKQPVMLNLSSGWFVFPPSGDGEVKVARHAYGYINSRNGHVSIPCTTWDIPNQDIPREGHEALREGLREVYPELADLPFTKTRICWYSDTPTGDFLVSWHPSLQGLFLAGGGSGHAFKFAPILGRLIVDVMEGKDTELVEKWKWKDHGRVVDGIKGDGSRGGLPARVELSSLYKSPSRL